MNITPTTRTVIRVSSALDSARSRTLEKLGTGQKINRGRDDPSGMISSEQLRAALRSLEAEGSALQRSDQVANVADAALGEASRLLGEAAGLETQLANGGALSSDEKAAIQGQID